VHFNAKIGFLLETDVYSPPDSDDLLLEVDDSLDGFRKNNAPKDCWAGVESVTDPSQVANKNPPNSMN
jgi:hypothetical protein